MPSKKTSKETEISLGAITGSEALRFALASFSDGNGQIKLNTLAAWLAQQNGGNPDSVAFYNASGVLSSGGNLGWNNLTYEFLMGDIGGSANGSKLSFSDVAQNLKAEFNSGADFFEVNAATGIVNWAMAGASFAFDGANSTLNWFFPSSQFDFDDVAGLAVQFAGSTLSHSDVAGIFSTTFPNSAFSHDDTAQQLSWNLLATSFLFDDTATMMKATGVDFQLLSSPATDGIFNMVSGTGSFSTASGWTNATGTATRTDFDPLTVTLPQLAERVTAIINDLFALKAFSV